MLRSAAIGRDLSTPPLATAARREHGQRPLQRLDRRRLSLPPVNVIVSEAAEEHEQVRSGAVSITVSRVVQAGWFCMNFWSAGGA